LEDGHTSELPQSGFILASLGLEVCDGAHSSGVMKKSGAVVRNKKATWPLAKEDGVSLIRTFDRTLNRWIAGSGRGKSWSGGSRGRLFKKRAGNATGEGLMKFLRTAPKIAPEPEDTLR
jgi:hypothetical protein